MRGQVEAPTGQCYANQSGINLWAFWMGMSVAISGKCRGKELNVTAEKLTF